MQGKETRSYTIEDYKKVLNLKELGLSQNKISRLVDLSPTTVWYWTNTNRKPRVLYGERKEKKLPENAKSLTLNLAYIYGVLVGDGSISKETGTYRLTLNVIDEDFAHHFSETVERWCGFRPSYKIRIMKYDHSLPNGRRIKCVSKMHVVRVCSKQLGEFLLDKGKFGTYNWEVPQNIVESNDKQIICNFLKGVFDSDGYVVLSGHSRRIELEMFFTRGLEQIRLLLEKIGIKSRIDNSKGGKGTRILRITKRENIVIFAKCINFTLERRGVALEKLIESYKRKTSPYSKNEVEDVIKQSIRNGSRTANEISKCINRSLRVTHYHLSNLAKRGELRKVERWRTVSPNTADLWYIKG